MKRLLCKWIPVCAMGAVLCACGGGVADGDYVSAFKEYVLLHMIVYHTDYLHQKPLLHAP